MTHAFTTLRRVADLMTPDVASIDAAATVAEAVIRLADEHVSALAVTTPGGRLVGVVSTTDVLQAEAGVADRDARNSLFENTTVADIMSRKPITVAPDVELREAARQMLHADVHRLFVDLDGRLVGVISQSDLVRALATRQV
jgi:acetoin utilization protein AcuB